MTVSQNYYRYRLELVSGRIERLRDHIDRAWQTVNSLEISGNAAADPAPLPTLRAAQIAAASAIAGRLEEHARRLQIALEALEAELDDGRY